MPEELLVASAPEVLPVLEVSLEPRVSQEPWVLLAKVVRQARKDVLVKLALPAHGALLVLVDPLEHAESQVHVQLQELPARLAQEVPLERGAVPVVVPLRVAVV